MGQEWKIRNMDEADSREAVRAAERHNTTVGVWLGQAIRAHVATERGNGVPHHDVEGPQADWSRADLIAMAGLPLPQWLRSRVHRLLGEMLGVAPPPLSKKLQDRRIEMAKLAAPQAVEPNNINEMDTAA